MSPPVVVIGAGVIGLTAAIVLSERGYPVQVLTADLPPATTSAVAGALWGPWLVEPRARVLEWSQETLRVLHILANEPDSGVRIATGREVTNHAYAPPDWARLLPNRARLQPHELPTGYSHGVRYSAPLIDMPVHLAYLTNRLEQAGGSIQQRRLTSLADATDERRTVIVNCTGLGARQLVPDPDLYPVRGYHLVTTNPGLSEFLEADTGHDVNLLAIYPHANHVVLGGTAEPYVWERQLDETIARAILNRCLAIEPKLAGAQILEHRIGLRPTRPRIRLDIAQSPNNVSVIHCYGHSGAGVSLAWGCAAEIANRVETQLR